VARSSWLWLLLVAGCSSTPEPPKPWSIQIEWSGGKPPGTARGQLLRSNGRYEQTTAGVATCTAVVPLDVIAPITAELGTTKLDPGAKREQDGSIVTFEVITIGQRPYGFPSRTDAPALRDAFERAVAAAAPLCRPEIIE
jgi:hypothetical protein